MRFDDKELMNSYLKVTKSILIPSLKAQTCQNFKWFLMIRKEDEDRLKSELDYPFIPIYTDQQHIDYVIENGVNIQTRHDCDDLMFPNYIETIQRLYLENKDKYEVFLIQSQPTQLIYSTGEVKKIGKYHDTRTSMHLSLCQAKPTHHIHEHQHGQMWKLSQKIINLGEGYTQWVIHGNNISVTRKKK